MLHVLTLGSEALAAVEPIHRTVKDLMRPAKVRHRRHRITASYVHLADAHLVEAAKKMVTIITKAMTRRLTVVLSPYIL